MNRPTEIELMRLLHGELPAEQAGALRARMAREPELAAALARLERTWSGLELPPAAPAPPAFAQRVLAQARRQPSLSWSAAPRWARATAAAALAAGLALGLGAGKLAGARSPQDTESVLAVSAAGGGPSLAETWWDSLDDLESTPAAATDADGEQL
jgi:anti-sigma factor RsiW